MKYLLITLLRSIFAKPAFFSLNSHIFKLQLRTLGILNSETEQATGEPWFMQQLALHQPKVIADVGANDHAYGQEVFQRSIIFAFEPHPKSFERLRRNKAWNVVPIEAAVGDTSGPVTLWDFADTAPRKNEQPTSQLATLHSSIISNLYKQPSQKYQVNSIKLDDFFKDQKRHIDILKIDAEGNELAVIKGAQKLLQANKIDIIQFEFNETHAYSHVLMKDFYDQLPNFQFYRLLPSGIVALGEYRPLTHELFGFQNIVAIRQNSTYSTVFNS